MSKYILRRELKKVETKEVEVDNWEDAAKQLDAFHLEPVPDDCVVVDSLSSIEYIGE